ncbi:MAG: NADH-quinone oxidoreductase subunit E [Pararhizobium sp.]
MSVRRLAEGDVQPAGFRFTPENADWAAATIRKYPEGRQQSAVIPLLMRAQEQDGWVTRAAIESVADMLGMPYIRALEVATFYTQFQLKPIGTRAHVQVCGTTPCMLRGAEALMEVCRRKINTEQFDTNETGTLSWEEVECQGACVNAPMVMIFKDTYEDLTPERLEEIIDAFEAGKGAEVPVGTQIDRVSSAPAGGLTTLLREETGAARGSRGGGASRESGENVPPSKAARPVTSAAETDASLNSPSPRKTSGAAEENHTNGEEAEKAAAASGRGDSVSGSATGSASTAEDIGRTPSKASDAVAGEAKREQPDQERPAAIERPAKPDDLKMIGGIGPRIEEKLNGLGFWTWGQLGNWSKTDCDWVDAQLNLRGRIAREDWVNQAKVLARGGEAEYVKVFGRSPR